MNQPKALEELLRRAAGTLTEVVDRRAAWDIQRKWRQSFLPIELPDDLRKLSEWGMLASGLGVALKGSRAIDRFRETVEATTSCSIIVTIELGSPPHYVVGKLDRGFVDLITDGWDADLYVISADFEWTFIETHEGPQIGPFFAVKRDPPDE